MKNPRALSVKPTITHTSSGSKLEYDKIGKDRPMHDKPLDEQMKLPKALQPEIKGDRKLSVNEVQIINQIKENAIQIGQFCDNLDDYEGIDKRWLAIARTMLQQGFMAMARSIAKPETF